MSRSHLLHRAWRLLCTAAFVATVVAWVLFLRPQYLGGPAGYVTVSGKSMEPMMHTGDVVMTQRQDSYRTGDVIAYRIPRGEAGEGQIVIHRLVGGTAASGYVLRGDNRTSNDRWRPKPSDVVGKKALRIPALGRFARRLSSPIGLGLLAAFGTIATIAMGPKKRDETVAAPS